MDDPAQILQRAVTAHRAGSLGEAETLYRTLLTIAPDHADTLHLLGVVLHQQGQSSEAVTLIERAIARQPAAPYYNNLGNALRALGRFDEAAAACAEAIERQPDYAGAHHNRGLALQAAGRHEEAEAAFGSAVEFAPELVDAQISLAEVQLVLDRADEVVANLGALVQRHPDDIRLRRVLVRAHADAGQLDDALGQLKHVLEHDPNDVDALNELGLIRIRKDDAEGGRDAFNKALKLNPDSVETLNNLGDWYRRRERNEQAIPLLRRAAELAPDSAKVLVNLGLALNDGERIDEAIPVLERAVEFDETFDVAWNALGNCYRARDRFDEALTCYERAEAVQPGSVDVFYNRGKTLLDVRRLEEAVVACDRCLELLPEFGNAHVNRFFAKCLLGRMEEAWPDFDWRFRQRRPPRLIPGSHWAGESLRGRRVFVYGEQGLGDEVMFASCVPDVMAEAESVVIECSQRLMTLFERSFPGATVIARPWDDDERGRTLVEAADVRIPTGTLPRYLRAAPAAFPRATSFLRADAAAVETWRERFAELGDGPTVGIAWFGGLDKEVRRLRSTDLVAWRSILGVPNAGFVNLQYGDCVEELRTVREELGVEVHDFRDGNPMTDLDGFSAKLSALDLVISVDNSTVHLAGALGVPTWALIPWNADWRWFAREHDTYWYRSVRLFRQAERLVWQPVYETVRDELHTFVAETANAAAGVPNDAARHRVDVAEAVPSPRPPMSRSMSLIRPTSRTEETPR